MKSVTRQEQIVSHAIELMSQGGIQNVTIKNIALAIGISEPALYRHFKNKQAILLGILDAFEEVSCAVLGSLDPSESALERLRLFVFDRYARFKADPALAKLMFSEAAFEFDPLLSQRLLKIMHRHRDTLVKVIRDGQEHKEFRADIGEKELFRIVIGSTRLVIQQWILSGFGFDLEAEGARLWNALEKLLCNSRGEISNETRNNLH